jgi:hypothetical protein
MVTVTIGWSNTDPYIDNSTPLTITNSQTFSILPGANIIFTGSIVAFADKFIMCSFPETEPTPTIWANGDPLTALNQGPIPDAAMRAVWTVGALKYVCTRVQLAIDTAQDFRLNH